MCYGYLMQEAGLVYIPFCLKKLLLELGVRNIRAPSNGKIWAGGGEDGARKNLHEAHFVLLRLFRTSE